MLEPAFAYAKKKVLSSYSSHLIKRHLLVINALLGQKSQDFFVKQLIYDHRTFC